MLDRLMHHATVVQIGGDSYRLRDKERWRRAESQARAHVSSTGVAQFSTGDPDHLWPSFRPALT